MEGQEFKINKAVLNKIEHHAGLGLTQEQISSNPWSGCSNSKHQETGPSGDPRSNFARTRKDDWGTEFLPPGVLQVQRPGSDLCPQEPQPRVLVRAAAAAGQRQPRQAQ